MAFYVFRALIVSEPSTAKSVPASEIDSGETQKRAYRPPSDCFVLVCLTARRSTPSTGLKRWRSGVGFQSSAAHLGRVQALFMPTLRING